MTAGTSTTGICAATEKCYFAVTESLGGANTTLPKLCAESTHPPPKFLGRIFSVLKLAVLGLLILAAFSLCSADHEQDWQPCLVDPYSVACDRHT